jgi:hypothetical protein
MAASADRLDRFAELLSLDIRVRMGLSQSRAYDLLARLRAEFGRQAQ